MKIRQSTIGNADACLRKMQYSIEDPLYYGGIVRAVGTGYHAGVAYGYLARMEGRTWPTLTELQDMAVSALNDEIEKSGDRFVWDPQKFKDFDAAVECIGSMLMHYVEDGHVWPADWEVLGVELPFTLAVRPDLAITSSGIDLVLRDPVGWVRGVDHKTAEKAWSPSKASARKNNQGPLYWGALRELFPDAAGWAFTFDVIKYNGDFQRLNCDPTEAHFEAIVDKAAQLASLYQGMRQNGLDLPANPSSNLCSARYCDFWSICPHGEILDGPKKFA